MDSFSNATAAAFVRYLTFTGTARRCGSFHYWRKATTYCYLFLAVYKTIRVFFILSLCKKSFSFSSNAHLPSSILKENKRNIQKQLLGDVQQKRCSFVPRLYDVDIGWPVLHKKVILTGDCFFSHIILPEINKNGFVLQRISYSRAINKVKTGTFCRKINYSAEHLKVPDNYR